MELDLRVKLAVYRHFAETGRRPDPDEVGRRAGIDVERVPEAYRSLREQRLLLLEPDGVSIRMAPPFSGVPTQHRIEVAGLEYFANCAWDALAIPAALHRPVEVHSRCEQSLEPLQLAVGLDGPEPTSWLFHTPVPAARWWQDIVYT